jgi:hypothetical protein
MAKDVRLLKSLKRDKNQGMGYGGSNADYDFTFSIQDWINESIADGDITGSGLGVTDGNKGDVTVSGTGTVWSLNNIVTAGTKINPTITVDAKGRITGIVEPSFYSAGSGCYVYASNTGVTFAKNSGTSTLTVPTGVKLYKFVIQGTSSDLQSGTNFIVNVITSETTQNTTLSNINPPSIEVINSTAQLGGSLSTSLPFIYNQNTSPQKQLVSLGTGDIGVRLIGMEAYSNWIIVGTI